jgi:hypothetical protein
VARSVVMPAGDGEGHTHSSELSRWDQAYQGDRDAPPADPGTALGDLVAAAVRAAVVAGEAEARRWFSWPWYWTDTLIADLVRAGRLRRIDAHLAAGWRLLLGISGGRRTGRDVLPPGDEGAEGVVPQSLAVLGGEGAA